ncbi:methionine-tRNA ligase (MARS2) [Vairimorpha necatrix]|uniref:Methionine-tRNA ligase (MARS2) n=1 Tax=Vairimorpha necatrix TaxID=6039 RepID=A0AAX4JGA4_9MICR
MILKYSEDSLDIIFALQILKPDLICESTKLDTITYKLDTITTNKLDTITTTKLDNITNMDIIINTVLETQSSYMKDIKRIRNTLESKLDNEFLSLISLYNIIKDLIIRPNLKNIKYIQEMIEKYKIEYILFNILNIQVGEIMSIEEVEGSNKLYKERVRFLEDDKIIVSGLRDQYKKEDLIGKKEDLIGKKEDFIGKKEDLIGKKCLFITNIKKSKIMGHESHGMILCGKNEDTVRVLSVEDAVHSGTRVNLKKNEMFKNIPVGMIDLKKKFYKDLIEKMRIEEGIVKYQGEELVVGEEIIKSEIQEGTIS